MLTHPMNRLVTSLTLSLCLVCGHAGAAEPKPTKTASEKAKKAKAKRRVPGKAGDLEGNLYLLNQWEEQPETIQQLYAAAYKVLAADPHATFIDLASDPTIRRICKENGIVHLGGPMLGSVTADGARVWMRTLRPAEVEVRVTVDGAERSFGPVSSTPETDLAAVAGQFQGDIR